jgi:hypothetical protein
MKDYHQEMEDKENSPESVETGVTLKIDPTVSPRVKPLNPSTQYDSEGMCLEE